MQKVYEIKEYFAAVVAILRSTFTLLWLQNWKWTVSHRKPVNGRSVFVFISSALTKGS